MTPEKIEAYKLLNTYTPKMSARQQYWNLVRGLAEWEMEWAESDPEGYLKEQGYDLDEVDRQGKELFAKLQAQGLFPKSE